MLLLVLQVKKICNSWNKTLCSSSNFVNSDNAKFLQQLKSCFKRTTNWNKYQSDPKWYAQNLYLNHLVDPSFQGVNRRFVLSFENEDDRKSHSGYYLPKVEINDYCVMTDDKNLFDRPINNNFSY